MLAFLNEKTEINTFFLNEVMPLSCVPTTTACSCHCKSPATPQPSVQANPTLAYKNSSGCHNNNNRNIKLSRSGRGEALV